MKFLNVDEREALVAMTDQTEGIRALLKTCEELNRVRNNDVLNFNLTPSNFNELALTKARADGARSLVADLRRFLDSLKVSPK